MYKKIPEAWMGEHISHHGDTLQHMDEEGYRREA